ncbi:MAG: hypothetical protein ACOYO1_17760 [Bacteroidales bacterium]
MEKNNDIHNFKILTIYSVITYIIAYFVVFLTYNIVTAIVANLYDIKTTLNFSKLYYAAKNGSPLWTYDSALNVFGIGTLVLGVGSLILMRVYKHYKHKEGLIKLFLFWIILHSINRIIGLFLIGTIIDFINPNLGLWYSNVILLWISAGHTVKILLIISAIALLFGIGSKSTRPLLFSAKSLIFVQERKRLFFVWSQAFKVWFISSIILFLIHLPSVSLAENFLSLSMLFLIFPSYFNHQSVALPHSDDESNEPEYKMPRNYIIGSIVIILLLRVILGFGISF